MLWKLTISSLVLLFSVSAFPADQDPDVQKPEGFSWRTDLAKARVDAKEAGKPLLIVFR